MHRCSPPPSPQNTYLTPARLQAHDLEEQVLTMTGRTGAASPGRGSASPGIAGGRDSPKGASPALHPPPPRSTHPPAAQTLTGCSAAHILTGTTPSSNPIHTHRPGCPVAAAGTKLAAWPAMGRPNPYEGVELQAANAAGWSMQKSFKVGAQATAGGGAWERGGSRDHSKQCILFCRAT